MYLDLIFLSMVRFSFFFVLAFLFFSCSQERKLELIPFPDKFYTAMNYDTMKLKYFIASGDSLYNFKNRMLIDSLILNNIPKGKDTFTVFVFKEDSWDNFTRNDFGANEEPFGDEWESIWGYLNYSVTEFRKDTIYRKMVFDNLKLLEK